MNKKVLSVFLVLALLIALVPQLAITASAKTIDSGTCGNGVTWTFTDDGLLTISGNGAMDDYASSSDTPWASYRSTTSPPTNVVVQNIIVEDGVTSIGSNAFCYCEYLKSITIGADVNAIGSDALKDCSRLLSITVDSDNQTYASKDGVLFTKDGKTLLRCPAAKAGSYSIPAGTVEIAKDAFVSCGNLTSVQMPDSVTTLGPRAFGGCIRMTNITLSNRLSAIPNKAFSECLALESVRIPASVTSIGQQAFYSCGAMKEIAVCGNVTSVGDMAFSWWDGEAVITFTGNAPTFGILVFEPMKVTVRYPANDATWTADIRQNYGGQVTWQAYAGACPGGLACAGYAFTDMPAVDNWAHNGIEFAIENGITTGTGGNKFSPDATCTRSQIVTFLWRAAGKPAPTNMECSFSDVNSNDYFYQAVLWAVENGITSGTGGSKFSPLAPCNRDQVVTFLWRAAGKPAPTNTDCSFTDVDPQGFYYDAMLWAVENGITSGTGGSKFSPTAPCSRGQIVTFLYRFDNID